MSVSARAAVQAVPAKSVTKPVCAPAPVVLQRKCACGSGAGVNGECAECGRKRLQRTASSQTEPTQVPTIVHEVLRSPGQALDDGTREFMKPYFGHDFSRVRIHSDAKAAASAAAVDAVAYTVGSSIVFGLGRYAPETMDGQRLLAHELTHVMQQSHAPGGGNGPIELVTDRNAEMEAEQAEGATALANPVSPATSTRTPLPGSARKLQRTCVSGPCPRRSVSIGAQYPRWRQAELCIQQQYAQSHRGSRRGVSLSFNADWLMISGGSPAERQALRCLRGVGSGGPHLVGPSGMFAGQPDLWDFHNRTMYEITTASGLAFRIGKLAAEISNANSITGTAQCGGMMFSPGSWAPLLPCLRIDRGLFIRVRNVGGVLVYEVLRERRSRRRRRPSRRRPPGRMRGPRRAPAPRAPRTIPRVGPPAVRRVGAAAWRRFWRVVVRRFALRGAVALGLAAADGPLPIGDIIGLGLAVWTVYDIISLWDELWREAELERPSEQEEQPEEEPQEEPTHEEEGEAPGESEMSTDIPDAASQPGSTPPQPPPRISRSECETLRDERASLAAQIFAIEAEVEASRTSSRNVDMTPELTGELNLQRDDIASQLAQVEQRLGEACAPAPVPSQELVS